jgi:hypothetical protein
MVEHHDDPSQGISIWFFIGSLLLVYGVIILIANLFPSAAGPEAHVVLANLHAGIWWGALLIGLGTMYAIVFWPGRT